MNLLEKMAEEAAEHCEKIGNSDEYQGFCYGFEEGFESAINVMAGWIERQRRESLNSKECTELYDTLNHFVSETWKGMINSNV